MIATTRLRRCFYLWFIVSLLLNVFLIFVCQVTPTFEMPKCPKQEILTDFQSLRNSSAEAITYQCAVGQLGNRMFYYALVYGLSTLNRRSGYIQECNVDSHRCHWFSGECRAGRLDDIFNISLPVRQDVPTSKQVYHYVQKHISFPEDYFIPPDVTMIAGDYPISMSFFQHVQDQIRKEFRFRPYFERHANQILRRARGHRTDVTFVGVHVRQGDFDLYLTKQRLRMAPVKFYQMGFKMFKELFPNCLFVVVSDDLKWCRQNLVGEDIYIPDKGGLAAEDLSLLAHCNHSIFDYGTYGFWGAYLTGGIAIYYSFSTERSIRFDPLTNSSMPDRWIKITSEMLT